MLAFHGDAKDSAHSDPSCISATRPTMAAVVLLLTTCTVRLVVAEFLLCNGRRMAASGGP